jgi:signal transduction histidine kinase
MDSEPPIILIVDDSPQNLRLLIQILTQENYKVRAANNGVQALESARQQPPSLILLDVMMPEMNGYIACTQLKADPATYDIPVIFLSAMNTTEDKVAAFKAGGVDYITKPFHAEEVLVRIATHLKLREMQQQLRAQNARLEKEVAERQRAEAQILLLHELDMAILGAATPEAIASIAATRLRQTLEAQRVTVLEFRVDEAPKILVIEAGDNLIVHSSSKQAIWSDIEMFSRLCHIPDLETVTARSPVQEQLYSEGIRAYMSIPLPFQQQLIGALVLEAQQPHAFAPEAIDIATQVAITLAIGIHQARVALNLREEIAERQQAQATLQAYTQELEISNAELDAFAHTVAHDLKNPLAGLLGIAYLLEKRAADRPLESIVKSARHIARAGEKMNNIIDELLLLASVRKLEEIPRTPLDTDDIVNEALARLEEMLDEYEATLTLPEHWPVAIGYAPWIEEVWVNYLSNALKYGGHPEEGIAPQVSIGYDLLEDKNIRFWVQDNGPGLSAEEQAQLFTQFTRLHQARAGGHGLGLSIVQRIMTRLGGTVGVESHGEQRGSCFYFTLPADESSTATL